MHIEAVTFFRPDEVSRKTSTLSATIYNHTRLLLSRSSTDCQFVPIRTLQYMGVISRNEVIFVDSQNYAVRDGEGGRMIMMAWEFGGQGVRESLIEPLSFEVVHYNTGLDEVELRLYREFADAMKLLLKRQHHVSDTDQKMNVVSITG